MSIFEDFKLDRVFDCVIIVLLVIIMGLLVKDVFFREACECAVLDDVASIEKEEKVISFQEDVEENVEVMVDIKGAVKTPGVYKVSENSIINDVIKLAGGLKSNASTKYINLSKKVLNEMVITIYTNSEISKMNNATDSICKTSDENLFKCEGSSIVVSSKDDNADNDKKNNNDLLNNKVSINTGSKEELMTLNGVGESKALAIIDYRDKNNGFKTLEELMNVSGIGEAAYNKIKDNITL